MFIFFAAGFVTRFSRISIKIEALSSFSPPDFMLHKNHLKVKSSGANNSRLKISTVCGGIEHVASRGIQTPITVLMKKHDGVSRSKMSAVRINCDSFHCRARKE